jgi:hypothetical protein
MKKHLRAALDVIRSVASAAGLEVGEPVHHGHYKVPLLRGGRAVTFVVVSCTPRSGVEEQINMARQATQRAVRRLA